MSTAINPAAWVEDFSAPFGLGISANSEIVFARQFKSQADSAIAVPHTPYNLPINAKRALEKLQAADFVSFRTNLSLPGQVTLPIVREFIYDNKFHGSFSLKGCKLSRLSKSLL